MTVPLPKPTAASPKLGQGRLLGGVVIFRGVLLLGVIKALTGRVRLNKTYINIIARTTSPDKRRFFVCFPLEIAIDIYDTRIGPF